MSMTESLSESGHEALRNIVEAALLAADNALRLKDLRELFLEDAQPDDEQLLEAIQTLQADYEGRGIELVEIAGGYRIRTREQYATWVGRLFQARPKRLSRALLETLAIIAYRQPVTRGEIEEIRGVAVSTDIIARLAEHDWIREVGRRDVPGRPVLYGTTSAFLEFFQLNHLGDLPPLNDARDLADIAREMNIEMPSELAPAQGAAEGEVAEDSDPEDDVETETTGEIHDEEQTEHADEKAQWRGDVDEEAEDIDGLAEFREEADTQLDEGGFDGEEEDIDGLNEFRE